MSAPSVFASLPSFKREEMDLWNWRCRAMPGVEWRAWASEIFGRLLEKRAGEEIQLVQSDLVSANKQEKVLKFGSKREVLIGRGIENDIVLPANAIATRHARLVNKDGRFFLEDLGSSLGTYLKDRKIQPRQLYEVHEGDHFTVFPYSFRPRLERLWAPETSITFTDCRSFPVDSRAFMQNSPAGSLRFVLTLHPSGEKAIVEIDQSFLETVAERALGPLGLDVRQQILPSDEAVFEFIVLDRKSVV